MDWLGLEDVRFREIDPECIDRYVFEGYEGRLVKGRERWEEVLGADLPRERDNIHRFLDLVEACTTLMRIVMRGPSAAHLARTIRFAPGLLRAVRLPFSELLGHFFDDPMLRNVFAGPGGNIGLPPSRASSLISLMVLRHFLGGAYYPVGGSGAIRDAYVEGLKKAGAQLLRNQRVERIEVLGDERFVVHTARGGRFEARSVISNADVVNTVDMLDGARPSRKVRRKVKDLRPSLGAFCVFVGTDLDLRATGLSDANVWHYGCDDIEEGYAAAFDGRISEHPFFFLTAPSLKDPDTVRAPEGHHTLEMITFVPSGPFKPWFDKPAMRRGPAYEAVKEEVASHLLKAAERYVPGLRDHVVIQESSTPATVWHFVRGREGGIYGPEHSPDQSIPRRIPTAIGIPGLYLAGASVLGAGVLPCMSSGAMAARRCKHHLRSTSAAKRSTAAAEAGPT